MDTKRKGRKSQWAVIFWPHSKETDVIKLECIPNIADRKKGGTPMLTWVDRTKPKSKKKTANTKFEAHVLEISDNRSYLLGLVVDETGQIVRERTKALTLTAKLDKKESSALKSLDDVAVLKSKLKVQEELNSARSIFAPRKEASLHVTVPSDDESSSSSENESEDEDGVDCLPAFKALMPTVTRSNIAFMEGFLKIMKMIYEGQNKQKHDSSMDQLCLDKYTKVSDKTKDLMEPFYPGSSCYLPKGLKELFESSAISYIPDRNGYANDWKKLVRQVLVEVYGNKLGCYAFGSRAGSRPPMDGTIRQELYQYATHFHYESTLDFVTFGKFVASTMRNKRKRKAGKSNKKHSEDEDQRGAKMAKPTDPAPREVDSGEPSTNQASQSNPPLISETPLISNPRQYYENGPPGQQINMNLTNMPGNSQEVVFGGPDHKYLELGNRLNAPPVGQFYHEQQNFGSTHSSEIQVGFLQAAHRALYAGP